MCVSLSLSLSPEAGTGEHLARKAYEEAKAAADGHERRLLIEADLKDPVRGAFDAVWQKTWATTADTGRSSESGVRAELLPQ